MRRCIGCYTSFPQDELIRFTFKDENIIADSDGKRIGRGFYLCRNAECLEMAIKKKSFNRVCKMNVDTDAVRQVVENLINNTKEDK